MYKFEHENEVRIFSKEIEIHEEIAKLAKKLAKEYKNYQFCNSDVFTINGVLYGIAVSRYGFALSVLKDSVVDCKKYWKSFSEGVQMGKAPITCINYMGIIGEFVDEGLVF